MMDKSEEQNGESDSKIRDDINDPKKVAMYLSMYQSWRKGEGKYAYTKDPMKNAPMPFTPMQLSLIENAAIKFLKEM